MAPRECRGSLRNSSNFGVVIMENLESTWVVFRKIGWLALLGFGVIVLSGPILAVLSVLLSVGAVIFCFALVGSSFGAFSNLPSTVRKRLPNEFRPCLVMRPKRWAGSARPAPVSSPFLSGQSFESAMLCWRLCGS